MGKKRVLVYGTGGRDHCLAEEYAESHHVEKVFFAPGNPGIKYTSKGQSGKIIQISIRDFRELVIFCKENKVDLVDVGPENPLDEGIIDILTEAGIPCIGPKREYTRLENDREFTNKLLSEIGVSKPEWKSFTNYEEAKKYVRNIGYQVVVKANGLAKGKGTIVCDNIEQAEEAINKIMVKKYFGNAGDKIIIEERKYGKELSFFAYLDGKHILPLKMIAQDYKPAFDSYDVDNIRLFRGNLNTGGTGCYCPHKLFSHHIVNKIIKEIVNPITNAIYKKLGWDYKGVLYFGLNRDPDGNLDLFEINVRHGDPEAEVILRKFQVDFYELGEAIINGTLDQFKPKWNKNYYVDIIAMVGRSKQEQNKWYIGYPKRYGIGYEIQGLENIEKGVTIFYAGVDEKDGKLVTKGGRVLHVVASSSNSLEEAREKAYMNIKKIKFLDHKNNDQNCIRYREEIGV
ncbi:MAG: phosphoribosylamine--glycine ligase [archaeon]